MIVCEARLGLSGIRIVVIESLGKCMDIMSIVYLANNKRRVYVYEEHNIVLYISIPNGIILR